MPRALLKVTALAFSRDGSMLASGGQDKQLALWATDTCAQLHRWTAHSSLIADVRLTTDLSSAPLLASAGLDRCVKLWRVHSDAPICVGTLSGYEAQVNSVDVTVAAQDRLATADADGNLKLWALAGARTLTQRERAAQRTARFEPNSGSVVAAGYAANAVVYDLSAPDANSNTNATHVLTGHVKPVVSLTWLGVGRLLTASEECVRLWDLRQPREPLRVYHAGAAKFYCVAQHPLSQNVALIGAYKGVHLWDWEAQRALVVPAHSEIVAALASSPATGHAASASHDRTVNLFACHPL